MGVEGGVLVGEDCNAGFVVVLNGGQQWVLKVLSPVEWRQIVAEEFVVITGERRIWIERWWEGWEEVVGEGEGGGREQGGGWEMIWWWGGRGSWRGSVGRGVEEAFFVTVASGLGGG